MKPAFSPHAHTRPPRLKAAMLAFALCACGAAHAKLPSSIEILGFDNPYSSDCQDVAIELQLKGLAPGVNNDLYFFFTVTQNGATKRFDGDTGVSMVLADPSGNFGPIQQHFGINHGPNGLTPWLQDKPFEFTVEAKLSPSATSGVRSETVSVSGCTAPITFTVTKPGGPFGGGSGATAVPTLGSAELLLSSLALAGAAAPALRRRKTQGKKADTAK